MQTVHVNIGISDQHREDIAAGLSKVLADSYTDQRGHLNENLRF